MSHRLYNRIEQIVQHISPQLDIFDKATLLPLSNNNAVETKNNLLPKKYQPITCNPNLRLYKYTKGQWFGRHVDGSNKIDLPTKTSSGNNKKYNATTPYSTIDDDDDDDVKDTQTEITVLFYLSSCNGGATRFHLPCSSSSSGGTKKKKKKGGRKTNEESGSIAFIPEEGAVLLHVHGDRCLEHEAEPVLNGVKYVLRTDIVYGIT